MKRMILVGFALVAILLTGCSQMNTMTNNNGLLSVSATKAGHMQEVVVRVVDARPANSIPPSIARLTQRFSIAAFYQPQIAQVMHANGFVPVRYQPNLDRKLTIQINNIEYQKATGGWLSSDVLKANIEADAINGVATYSRLYRGQVSVGSAFGGGDVKESDLKQLLTMLINKALSDKQLMQFIAADSPASNVSYE
jgi:uncharacterized lipoprotein YajG